MRKGMRKGLVEASGRHASKKQGFFEVTEEPRKSKEKYPLTHRRPLSSTITSSIMLTIGSRGHDRIVDLI